MDAVSQKANKSVCKEAGKPTPVRHWLREGHLRSEVEGSWVSVYPDEVTHNHSNGDGHILTVQQI